MAAAQAPAKQQMLVDPQSPAFDTPHDAARALSDRFGKVGPTEQAAAIIKGADGKYRYTTAIGGSGDHFEMHVGLHQGEKLGAIMHSHPGMDEGGKVFSPNDLDTADKLKVPSYVKFAAQNGAVRVYSPGVTKTRSMPAQGYQVGNMRVSDGDELPAPVAAATPGGPPASGPAENVPVTGSQVSSAPAFWNADPDPIGDQAPAPSAQAAPPAAGPPPSAAQQVEQSNQAAQAAKEASAQANQGPAQPSQQGSPAYWNAEPDQSTPYVPPPIANSQGWGDHLAGVAKGFGLGGRAITDFAAAGIQAIAAASDKLQAAIHGTTPEQMRREGTSMEQAVEQQREASQASKQALQPSNTAQRVEGFAGETAMFIAESIANPASDIATTGRVAGAVKGAAQMQGPAVMHGVDVAQQVYKQTNDPGAALRAGMVAWSSMTAMGTVPGAVGRGRLAGAASGAAIGVGASEAQRNVENAALPPELQQKFDPLQDTLMAVQGAVFGGIVHGGGAHEPVMTEEHHNVVNDAQAAAAASARAAGGDDLDAVTAATQASAEVGGVHDAAAVHQTRMELRRAQAQQELENAQAEIEQGQREQGLNQAEAAKAPETTPQQGFEAAEAEQAAQKEKDFPAAKNQAGDQEVAASKTAEVGAEKGGANEPAPTLAEALPPEQVSALAALRARLAGQPAAPAVEVHPDEDFQRLGPETAPKANEPAAPKSNPAPGEALFPDAPVSPHMGGAPPEEEEAPETNPAPVTAQTLAERRQQALDAAMAAKVRGEQPTVTVNDQEVPVAPPREGTPAAEGPTNRLAARRAMVAKTEEEALAPATPEAPIAAPAASPEAAPEPVAAKPNRIAAIRAAAQKAAARGGFVPSTDDQLAAYAARAAAKRKGEEPKFSGALANNASGESAASQEAVNRVADEKAAGQERFRIDADGNRTPLTGVDSVDAKAAPGELITRRGPDGEEILDRGGLNKLQANGLLNRAKARDGGAQFNAPSPMAQDVGAALRPSRDEVVAATKPIVDSLRPEVKGLVNIHHDDSTLPPQLRADALAQNQYGPNGELPRGVYDPATGQIHIIAQGHTDAEDAARTTVHELTHFGLRNVLGDQYTGMLRDIYNNASGEGLGKGARQWMADYAEQHGLDLKNPDHQVHVADEYVAHLADTDYANPGKTPGILKRAYQSIRGMLHDMGLKFNWSDDDIRDLVRRNNTLLRDVRPDVAERESQMRPRWASAQSDTDPTLQPTDPESVAAKFGRTMEEQASHGPATLRSRMDWLKGPLSNLNAKSMSARLAWLHMDSLQDIVREMKTPREFTQVNGQMAGRAGRIMEEGNQIALKRSRWENGGMFVDPTTGKMKLQKGNAEGAKALNTVQQGSTLAGVHPDRPYEPQFEGNLTPDQAQAESLRKGVHAKLKDLYDNKLDTQGRQIYQQEKQFYQDRRADTLRALEARIAETGANAATKKQAMADLRKTFEQGSVKGPYFPLARFGDYWARGVDPKTGEHYFSRFEDVMQRKRWLENAQANGLDVTQGTKITDKALMERVDPDFVKSVMGATEGHADLQDEIWQHYLKSMPEMSMRKNLIHRKGVLGYSEDGLRAFAYNAFHSAHQISRLEYGNRLDTIANNMQKEADGISSAKPNSANATWAPEVAAEFRRRLDWIKNPRANSLASGLTKLGFNWFIGASPATAIRISTQNAMLAEPYLSARASKLGVGYGAGRAELWKAVGQWSKLKGSAWMKGQFGSSLGDALRGDERAMFDEARARGTFSSTASQTLASGGADRPMGVGKMDAWNRVSSAMFNMMEHKNRETTALAMYRIARRSGMDHAAATEEAIDASNKAHFNYSNYNRPRVLQSNTAKVIGLFKQYPWQVTDRLARSFRDGVMRNPELSDADKNEQLKAFAGYMGKMMLFAGVKGVPILYHATMAAINTAFGTKDKPFDAQAALREHLEDSLGKTDSDAIMDGPMSALTGAALSNGASYADLWYKQPNQDLSATGYWADLMGQLGGPIPSIGAGAAQGADIAAHGDLERGLEHFAPPGVNHLMKANRMANEGVTNLRGEQVVSPEELGQGYSTDAVGLGAVRAKNLALQALGFTPEVVARQYEKNTSENNFNEEIHSRQQELMTQYENANRRGDQEAAIKWMQQLQAFHAANPGVPWSAKGLETSLRMNAKRNAGAVNGVNMPPGIRNEYQQMTGAPQP